MEESSHFQRISLHTKRFCKAKFTQLTHKCNQIRSVSLPLYFLFILFGLVSWTAANGVLSESPVLTALLPECYRLTSYIIIIVQSANIGPLVYLAIWGVFKLVSKNTHYLDVTAIYCILIFAFTASIFTMVFWSWETIISDVTVSLPFFILTGCLAISDCTSTVLFLPFVALYPTPYISALYIGEGLSGVLPSFWALAQGSVSSECHQTSNTTTGLRFSPTTYFAVITVTTAISLVAFTLILVLPLARKERYPTTPTVIYNTTEGVLNTEEDTAPVTQPVQSKARYFNLMQYVSIQTILCAFANSFLYSIAPYFTIPYGSPTFLWSLNLTLIAVPIGSFLGGVFNPKSTLSLWCMLSSYLMICTWLIFIAIWGSSKPLQGSSVGELHVILLFSFSGLIVGYLKVGVGVLAKNEGGPVFLLLIALGTQFGSFVGGIIAFGLVNYTHVFRM